MLKKIVLVVLVVFGFFVVKAALKPAAYEVHREVTIQATADKVFPYINNARAGDKWMPWSVIDPQMKMSFSGPDSGVGSKASWDSPGKMGVGSSTIAESVPDQSVRFDLEYVKPFAMKQRADITLTASGQSTLVRWSVSGSNPFFGRLMCTLMGMNMDKVVGTSFEQGLTKLKTLIEA